MPKGRGSQHRHRNRRQKLAAIANKLPESHPFSRWWDKQRKQNMKKKGRKRSVDRFDRRDASKGHSRKRSVG